MTGSSGKTRVILLGDDFGTAVVQGGGIKVELNSDGDVTVHTNGNVKLRPAANDDKLTAGAAAGPKIGPKVGEVMTDGTVYAGISPDTGSAMYTTPTDAPLTYTFNQARNYAAAFNQAPNYAAKLAAHGHQDWRVPTKGELNVLFQNRAAIGGFDESGSTPAGWYWSSSQTNSYYAWSQRLSDGNQHNSLKYNDSSLRCVR
jgi:hypothetical protein